MLTIDQRKKIFRGQSSEVEESFNDLCAIYLELETKYKQLEAENKELKMDNEDLRAEVQGKGW